MLPSPEASHGAGGEVRTAADLEAKMVRLRATELLGALSESDLRHLVDECPEITLEPGECIFEEGEEGRSLYLVLSGTAEVSKQGKKIAEGQPGEYYGEMALIEKRERSATLCALGAAVVMEIPEPQYLKYIAKNPQALLALLRTLSVRSRHDLETLADEHRKLQRYAQDVEDANLELNEIRRQLEDNNRKLERLSTLDTLTGLANRRRFDEALLQEWRRAARDAGSLSLIFCDIDFFKGYNDSYGHQAGDECLHQVACALAEVVNRPADLAARYGGEEFVVLLVDTVLEGAVFLAERMRARIESLHIAHRSSGLGAFLTASFGVASLIPRPGLKPEDVIALADHALYAAKQQGRNRVVASGALDAPAAFPEA
jgi:diguanylate cyclase (GGDEF)-like protein